MRLENDAPRVIRKIAGGEAALLFPAAPDHCVATLACYALAKASTV